MISVTGFSNDFIPRINNPEFSDSYYGNENDRMIVIETNKSAKAYPLGLLRRNHVVNDYIDGNHVAVTWTPLCFSAAIYHREIDDKVLTFGFGGRLYRDNFVMKDDETDTLWKQSNGVALEGKFKGRTLNTLPFKIMTWKDFKERYPDGQTLTIPENHHVNRFYHWVKMLSNMVDEKEGFRKINRTHRILKTYNVLTSFFRRRDHFSAKPLLTFNSILTRLKLLKGDFDVDYEDSRKTKYTESSHFGLPLGKPSPRDWNYDLDPKTRVLGVNIEDGTKGFPKTLIDEKKVVEKSVSGEDIVVLYTPEGPVAYRNPGIEFEHIEDSLFRGDGTKWDALTGKSEDHRELENINSREEYLFCWFNDYSKETLVREQID